MMKKKINRILTKIIRIYTHIHIYIKRERMS